jgi:hypothetical protein
MPRAVSSPSLLGDGLVEQAQPVAHAALGQAHEQAQPVVVDRHALGGGDLVRMRSGELVERKQAEVEALAAERMVRGILFGSVVAKKKYTRAGGSSRIFSRALNAPFESMCTSSMMKTRRCRRSARVLGHVAQFADVVDAGVAGRVDLEHVQVPPARDGLAGIAGAAGSPSTGASQLMALASSRATVVLPQPRGPVNRYAWATRPRSSALASVVVTCSCPTTSSKVCGLHFRARTWYAIRLSARVDGGSSRARRSTARGRHCVRLLLSSPDRVGTLPLRRAWPHPCVTDDRPGS